jgi:hypothetical protein
MPIIAVRAGRLRVLSEAQHTENIDLFARVDRRGADSLVTGGLNHFI